MLHAGHVEFFKRASEYGDVYVAIGSDRTVFELKHRQPINPEQERLFMVKSIKYVHDAFISSGCGRPDFVSELEKINPDLFIVNADGGQSDDKQQLCERLGIQYIILERTPANGLPARSTTELRKMVKKDHHDDDDDDEEMKKMKKKEFKEEKFPFRIDLSGGWLDQPWVSQHFPGPVITIGLEPTQDFNERSGMASSTRRKMKDLWGVRLPEEGDNGTTSGGGSGGGGSGEYEKLAKILFCYDNPPGTKVVSGSQDSIGLVFPGLAFSYYEGGYWPTRIIHRLDEPLLKFVESSLNLISLGPRVSSYDVLSDTKVTKEGAKALSDAATCMWEAILKQDLAEFGRSMTASFQAQVSMFPHMVNDQITGLIDKYHDQALGWKLSGAGGGGYLVLVSATPILDAIHVIARRGSHKGSC